MEDLYVCVCVQFEVLVSDAGSPPLTNTARVLVNVTDINDETPMFIQDSYTVPVSEGVSASMDSFRLLTTLQYIDGDTLLENTESTFSILDVTSPTNPDVSSKSFAFYETILMHHSK